MEVKYPKRLHELHSDLPFLSERMKIDKCNKLVCNLFNKKKYVTHINSLKQALNHGLKLRKIHRVIEFYQEEWLKPYIDMNTELRKAAKNDFEKDLFKLMNNSVFGKMMENIRKHRDIKSVTTDKKRSKLVSEPNCHTINLISLVKFNVIGLMKYELGGKIITEFVTLRPKTNSFLTDDGKEDKKAKGTKKCVIKKMIKFNDYKKCLLNDEVILKSQQRFIRKNMMFILKISIK